MDPWPALAVAAQAGNIESLYTLLQQNPCLLEDIDKIPFVDTPLHIAASANRTRFAIEILGLKPSFAKKLNPYGYSPIHLALVSGHTQTVKQLIRHDPELIRVKSKKRFTPLHYAAKMDEADLIAEFLISCPKSIEDLTVRGRTAVHIAVRKGNMRAFKVLLGWLSEADLVQLLNWQDDEGNTVLHIATSAKNLEAVNLIMKKREFNRHEKNAQGKTALDIAREIPVAEDIGRRIAKRLGGTFTKSFSASNKNLAEKFTLISEASSLREHWIRLSKPLIKESSGNKALSDETRQALLVVLVLIATATYQAILTPPPVFTRKKNETNNLTFTYFIRLLYFLLLNSLTFIVSILSMYFLFRKDGLGYQVKMPLIYLVMCYGVVMVSYFPLYGFIVLVMIPSFWCLHFVLTLPHWRIVRKALNL